MNQQEPQPNASSAAASFFPGAIFRDGLPAQIAKADKTALIALLIANFLPILFAICFQWSIGNVIAFYWWENLVVGFYAVLRLAFAGTKGNPAGNGVKVFLIPFFLFHYFFFCFVHGIFIATLNGGVGMPFNFMQFESSHVSSFPRGAILTIAGFFISHGISFLRNYIGKAEFRNTSPSSEMFRPYGRVVLLHVFIIFGGFLLIFLGAGSIVVLSVLFMLAKTAIDVLVHLFSHRDGKKEIVLQSD